MKRSLLALGFGALFGGLTFAGSAQIVLTAPTVTSWTYNGSPASASELNSLNASLQSAFAAVQNELNSSTFSKLHDLTQLTDAFANASMASFDNASLLGYQNYDLFALSVGTNLAVAVPTYNPSALSSALNSVATTGDTYTGASTGGFVGQFGLNLSQWVPRLYASVKAGGFPSVNVNGINFQQLMLGFGVNYTVLTPVDYVGGLFKWRGLSAGTGLTYTTSSTNVQVAVADQTSSSFTATANGTPVTLSASSSNTLATLSVNDTAVVIPVDLMTSIQVLWLVNVGLGVGADLAFSSATLKVGGSSNLVVNGLTGATLTPGSANLTATNSAGTGDLVVPRLAGSLGLDLSIFKIDVPVSFYPTTKAFAAGFLVGVVW